MSRHKAEPAAAGAAIGDGLAWLGGGSADADIRDRSTYQITGLIVLSTGLLAWLVTTVAIAASTSASLLVIVPITLVVGVLVGAVARALAAGRPTRWYGIAGRAAIALFIGLVLGELASIGIFNGAVDRELDQQSVERTVSAPAVVNATQALDALRADRAKLDSDVDAARDHKTEAYDRVACEFNPQPNCTLPVTGVPGDGPQTQDANEIYADAEAALALAEANRSQQAPSLDADIAAAEQTLSAAKAAAPSFVDRGLSGRWTAMHDYTVVTVGALLLRLLTIAFFAGLMLLPLLMKLMRGETSLDRSSAAEALRKQAELDAETQIAVERAAARIEAEKVWTEQKLTSTRFAAEAETAIEREQQRRRVAAAYDDAPTELIPAALDFVPAAALTTGRHQKPESTPIADEVEAEIAEAADLDYRPSTPRRELVPAARFAPPAPVVARAVEPHREAPPKPPSIGLPNLNPLPDITRAVTGIVKPLVPDVVTRVASFNPIRSARQRFEEFEEIKFTISRKRTVTVDSEEPETTYREVRQQVEHQPVETALPRVQATRIAAESPAYGLDYSPQARTALDSGNDWSYSLGEREGHRELVEREGPAALDERRGPRELPPGRQ